MWPFRRAKKSKIKRREATLQVDDVSQANRLRGALESGAEIILEIESYPHSRFLPRKEVAPGFFQGTVEVEQ